MKPTFFMSDFSEAEITALETTFPGITGYGCDFHHEQTWCRWIQDHNNRLTKDEGDQLLALLKHCAWATSAVSELELDQYCKLAVKALQDSSVWKEHENVRR